MFRQQEMHAMFPTSVAVFYLKDHEPLNRGLLAKVDDLRLDKTTGQKAGPTEFGVSWQSESNLHELKEFEGLVKCIHGAVDDVLAELEVEYESYVITECWANMNIRGVSHPTHSHPNSYLSGVYYAKAPENCGRIVFRDPRPQTAIIFAKPKRMNDFNVNQIKLAPQEGMLIVFPSWLQHFVQPNQSDEERLSISFNMMFKGELGMQLARTRY